MMACLPRVAQTVGGVTTEYVLDVAGELPEVIDATSSGVSMQFCGTCRFRQLNTFRPDIRDGSQIG
jgi:hypothetical protein